jgi:fumarylpyruvate hydrolase
MWGREQEGRQWTANRAQAARFQKKDARVMTFIFSPPPQAAALVAGTSARFPVRRVYCVGRNYEAHAREMGSSGRELPFFFSKPADAVVPVADGQTQELPYPGETRNYHYEGELVVAIGKSGADIAVDQALEHVWGYAVGLDMTRRDLQAQMRDTGRPWEVSKAFDQSAPLAPIHPVAQVGHFGQGGIWLTVNGQPRQKSDVADMIWSVPEIVAQLSRYFRLEPGDLIYTGTPDGVGPVKPGDLIRIGIDRLGEMAVKIV